MELDISLIVITIVSSIAILIQLTIGVMNAEHNTNLEGTDRHKREKKVVFINVFMGTISVLCFIQFSTVLAFFLGVVYCVALWVQITLR
jgi:hypothetical protein